MHVVGSINVDSVDRVDTFPKPGETVLGVEHRVSLGGKGANQAVAAHLLGADVRLIAGVGADSGGAFARTELSRLGLDTAGVVEIDGVPTGHASILVDASGENMIVVSVGANQAYSPGMLGPLDAHDIVLAQGEVSVEAIVEASKRAVATGARFVLNLAPPQPLPAEVIARADPLVVNEHEARALDIDPLHPLAAVSAVAMSVIVTRGAQGAVVADASGETAIPAPSITAVDTTGAGDAFVGALVASLAAGAGLVDATRVAVVAGAHSAQRVGTIDSYATPSQLEPLRTL